MSTRLFMGICNRKRLEEAKKRIEERNKKHPNAIKHPVCTVDQALQNPEVQKHFMFQRAQISGYERQAKIANDKNVGNLVRDVKSLIVPYLFSVVGFKPNKPFTPSTSSSSSSQPKAVTLSDYAKVSANANRYFDNIFAAGFKPDTRERGRRRRVPPFNRQLQYYWINNKKPNLKNAMESINSDPDGAFQHALACDKAKGNELEKKKAAFKKDFDRYKQNRIKGKGIYGDNSLLTQNIIDDDEDDDDMSLEDEGKGSG